MLVALLPEFEPAIGFDQESRYHDLTVDEHTFAVVQAAADAGAPLRVRLAALFHDLGKPLVAWRGSDGRLHYYAQARAVAPRATSRSAPSSPRGSRAPALSERAAASASSRSSARHMFDLGAATRCARGGCSRATATSLPFDLLDHKAGRPARQGATGRAARAAARAARARSGEVVEQRAASPHRLRDLAVDGDDLIALGYAPGPAIGTTLGALLDEVVERPGAEHARDAARARARSCCRVIRWDEPGYVVAFTTRAGGVSDGAYASLNLGARDGRRRRARRREPAARLRGARRRPRRGSRSTARCTRRRCIARAPGARGEPGDGLWTDEPGVPMLAMCGRLPADRDRAHGRRAGARRAARRLARARGRASSQRASRARRREPQAAIVGPAIGPCCYEVGPEVAGRFDADLTRDAEARSLDARPSARCAPPASSASSASTSARAATRSSSSRTAATAARAACRG